jgi:hypothetical protein
VLGASFVLHCDPLSAHPQSSTVLRARRIHREWITVDLCGCADSGSQWISLAEHSRRIHRDPLWCSAHPQRVLGASTPASTESARRILLLEEQGDAGHFELFYKCPLWFSGIIVCFHRWQHTVILPLFINYFFQKKIGGGCSRGSINENENENENVQVSYVGDQMISR